MNTNFLKALEKLAFTIEDIEKLMNTSKSNSFEDRQVYSLVENLITDMKSTIGRIEYYKKAPINGALQELPNGRFSLSGYELTCGNSIEVYSNEFEEWFLGRVEHSDKYYFYCHELDNPALYEGMEARIRI